MKLAGSFEAKSMQQNQLVRLRRTINNIIQIKPEAVILVVCDPSMNEL
jgi:hypothetical protein